jgi:hypothetical protein
LLAHKEVSLRELVSYPLVMCDPQLCEGYCRELTRLLHPLERESTIVEHVSSLDMMLTLVRLVTASASQRRPESRRVNVPTW